MGAGVAFAGVLRVGFVFAAFGVSTLRARGVGSSSIVTGFVVSVVAVASVFGVSAGVTSGDGVSAGVADGVSAGVADGVSAGVADGVSAGVADGVSVGVATGVSLGEGVGVSDGGVAAGSATFVASPTTLGRIRSESIALT